LPGAVRRGGLALERRPRQSAGNHKGPFPRGRKQVCRNYGTRARTSGSWRWPPEHVYHQCRGRQKNGRPEGRPLVVTCTL